jgi:hypothetical protein
MYSPKKLEIYLVRNLAFSYTTIYNTPAEPAFDLVAKGNILYVGGCGFETRMKSFYKQL